MVVEVGHPPNLLFRSLQRLLDGLQQNLPFKTKPGGGLGGGLRATGAAALAGALSTGSLRNPVSKAKEKEYRKKETEAGKKRQMPSMGKDYKSQEKKLSPVKLMLLILMLLLLKLVKLANLLLPGVVKSTTPNLNEHP